MTQFDLKRFVDAQNEGGIYVQALAELRAGEKQSHWMWFVFPQVRGLGMSSTSQYFAIDSVAEARAYLAKEVLGPRLLECTRAILALEGRSSEQIFGSIDGQKFQSSMTLFCLAEPENELFVQVLAKYFGGQKCHRTLEITGNANK